MAASKNVPMEFEIGDRNELPVAATKRLYEGSMAWLDGSGYVTNTPGDVFVGHVSAEADNRTGGNGDLPAHLVYGRYRLQVALTGVGLDDVGSSVYATDDNTYALSGDYLVGKVVRRVRANVAIVEFISPRLAAVGS
jgi:hypothetical protein